MVVDPLAEWKRRIRCAIWRSGMMASATVVACARCRTAIGGPPSVVGADRCFAGGESCAGKLLLLLEGVRPE